MALSLRAQHLALAAVCAVALLFVGVSSAAAAEIRLSDEGFAPDTIDVAPGEDIIWVNDSSARQTIVGEDGRWDSGPLAPGESFSVSLREPGTVAYGTADGAQLGEIIVQAAPTATVGGEDAGPSDPGPAAPTMPRTGQPLGQTALLAVALLSAGSALVLATTPRTGFRPGE